MSAPRIECVVNISEGADTDLIARLGGAAGSVLLDTHSDRDHNRTVFTLGGPPEPVEEAVRTLAGAAVKSIDLTNHLGVHPRIGAVDVVPWVDLTDPWAPATDTSQALRDRYAAWSRSELGVPCLLYGPERSLPELRRAAGAERPHPTAGITAVGARGVLVAYNLWLSSGDLDRVREVARALRNPAVRTLGLLVGGRPQVSCNLVGPLEMGPAEVYDAVAAHAPIEHAELVGLIPAAVLERIPRHRWSSLDVGEDRTIEARLTR